MTTLICNCNQTMTLDAQALGAALDEDLTVHTSLCRREAPAFQRATRSSDELVVACTQERRLFSELSTQTEGAVPLEVRPIRFVNIRETGGWGRDGARASAKMAALLALARLPEPEPVATVTYQSQGRLLVIGPMAMAEQAAAWLSDLMEVSLMATEGGGMQDRPYPVIIGRLQSLRGWLGAFELEYSRDNPIDLDICTRCNACVAACPEGAIGLDYQVDLARCGSHRDCVKACEAVGAIQFGRSPVSQQERFDLVLDLRPSPAFSQHALPQGYVHLPQGLGQADALPALLKLRDWVGEFEKPKFFNYKASVCAHGRNEQVGCNACVEVCSASAIQSGMATPANAPRAPGAPPARNQIAVNPHLCVGCGACTTVCPTGALSFAYPRASDQGVRLRTLLATYARAGGPAQAGPAALLLHSQGAGTELVNQLGRAAALDPSRLGVPARVIPLPLWHTASLGIDLWLSAFAFGAAQVWVLLSEEEAPQYRAALAEQMAVAQALLNGLGYSGRHFKLISARDARDLDALQAELAEAPAQGVTRSASFAVQGEKRATLDLALEHLLNDSGPQRTRAAASAAASPAGAAAPAAAPAALALPAGSPWGGIEVNRDSCTLCLSCVSACPANALQDNPERPQLRLIEKNCVQCGLCQSTCPENAITLVPRLLLGEPRKQLRVINEAPPYACVRCGKAFGTLKGIEAMLGKLSGHSMFQGEALERLKMCGDCRVVDLYSNPKQQRITDL